MAQLQIELKEDAVMGVANLMTECRKIASESPTGQVWFRGIQDVNKHRLVPSIGREHWFGGRSVTFNVDDERDLFSRFRKFARQFEGRTLDEWEAMFLARHHGLPVRLMDWTANPLVAFYLACEHESQTDIPDGCLWVLVPRGNGYGRLDILGSKTSPFAIAGVKLVDPIVVSPRIAVQGGIFTIHAHPWKPLEELKENQLDEDDLDVCRLIGYQILGEQKPLRLKELNDLGVNRRTLFPDLDGLARGLVNEEVFRQHATVLNNALRQRTPPEQKKVTWPSFIAADRT